MPAYHYFWTPRNEEHIAQHDVTREEFEDVVSKSKNVRPSHVEGRLESRGWSSTGRFLCCIYEDVDGFTIIPVTAYEL
ncbi:MAG: hypothetical protein KF861_22950 [Planctomycetaceae bacterium]|nr:hypothetical protein [Planctomycetaceae bacterium]